MQDLSAISAFRTISSSLGTAGQPLADEFACIRAAGYQVVINLALTTSVNAVPEERSIVEALGMEYIHLPIEWEAPTIAQLQQFFGMLQARADRPVFVHCAANKRVSVFIYLYRILILGIDPSVAAADLQAIWQPNEIWSQFIDCALSDGHR